MEKWARGLSKTVALIIGVLGVLVLIAFYFAASNFLSGFLGIILVCALLGGGIGFTFPLLYKGITGYTPQEKKELSQTTNQNLKK